MTFEFASPVPTPDEPPVLKPAVLLPVCTFDFTYVDMLWTLVWFVVLFVLLLITTWLNDVAPLPDTSTAVVVSVLQQQPGLPTTVFDEPPTVTLTFELASPVVIFTSPPVLKLAVLLPVEAEELTVVLMLLTLDWLTVVVQLLFTVTLLTDAAPFPETPTTVSAKLAGAMTDATNDAIATAAPSLKLKFVII